MTIDYAAAADEAKQDYMEVNFDEAQELFFRARGIFKNAKFYR